MSGLRRYQLTEELSPSFFLKGSPLLAPKTLPLNPWRFPAVPAEDELEIALDLLSPSVFHGAFSDLSSPFDEFGAVTDLIQIERTPFYSSAKRVQRFGPERYHLQRLCDRVSALELGFDRLLKEEAEKRAAKKKSRIGERKYTWTAEIKTPDEDGLDRTYKWVAEVKDGKKGATEKSYKLTTQIKGKGNDSPISRSYSFKTSSIDPGEGVAAEKSVKKKKKEEEKNKKKKPEVNSPCLVEIEEEPSNHGAIILKQAYAKRMEKKQGKRKELSPQDAAMIIQMTFKAYLVRRSKALRAHRDLAIAKAKLKELRAMFSNFSYRRLLARDAEERQKFSEKIIVLLLTIDAIEGADMLVRSTKKSMLDELEAMLDVVDPAQQQPAAAGRSASMRRRTFDMPDSAITREAAAGVAKVVQLLNESNCSESLGDYL
ncbi:hypothetical protein DM860_010869 [Cuscuta australis]|uniref:BAG domain-containing protein n=1 Tax=Cuscuta australis TaxID=267555 RepID=A0A328E094_9ASTE|nr:hypothetical protein DM860_010869 [Cuscuta australis]